jgi:hypothetical protein
MTVTEAQILARRLAEAAEKRRALMKRLKLSEYRQLFRDEVERR